MAVSLLVLAETRVSTCPAHHLGRATLIILGKDASRSTMNKTVAASRITSEPVSDLPRASSPHRKDGDCTKNEECGV
jgi:hypothetical protein